MIELCIRSVLALLASAMLWCGASFGLLPGSGQARAAAVTTLERLPMGELPTGLIETADGTLFGAVKGDTSPVTQDYAFALLPAKSPGARRLFVTLDYHTQCYLHGTIGNFVKGPDGVYGTNFAGGGGPSYIVQFSPRVFRGDAILVCAIVTPLGAGPAGGLPYHADLLGFGPDGALYTVAYETISGTQSFVLLQIVASGGAWTTNTVFTFPAGSSDDSMELHADGSISGTLHTLLSGDPVLFTLAPPVNAGGSWVYTPLFGPLTVAQDHPVTMDAAGNFFGIQHGSNLPGVTDELLEYAPPATPSGNWTETPIFTTTRHYPRTQLGAGPALLTGGDLVIADFKGDITLLAPGGGAWSPTTLRLGRQIHVNQGGFAPLVPGTDGNLYGMTYGSPGLLYQLTP